LLYFFTLSISSTKIVSVTSVGFCSSLNPYRYFQHAMIYVIFVIMPYVTLHVYATQAASSQRESLHHVVLRHAVLTMQKLVTHWHEQLMELR